MMKRKFVKLFLASCSLLCLGGIVVSSISWFNPKVTINSSDDEISASTMGAYFAYGNGKPATEEQPGNRVYGISKPRHLYNLAWLQYLGFFKDKSGNPIQPYFELTQDIDMSGWILPPIGTTDNPFIGNFEGHGYTISGLTVSNDFNSYTTYPYDVEDRFIAPQIVGFFGVVGQYENNTISYSSSINQIKNTELSNITVKTVTSNSLAGIAAGYVNGTLDKVAVNNSRINVQNNKIKSLANFDNISNYTIVGYCTDDYKESLTKLTDTAYQVTIDPTKYKFSAQKQGTDADWGGSINMKDMYNRVQNVYKSINSSTSEVTQRTYYHNADGTTTHYDSEDKKSSNFRRTHSRPAAGNFSLMHQGSNTDWQYLQGGVNERDVTYQYAQHAGKTISKGIHFLSVSNYTDTGGTLTDNSVDNATLWTLPDTSGYIYTSYYYDRNGSNINYYLYNNNGTLQLSTTNKTTWYKDVAPNGSIKYYDSHYGYYIDYNSTWKLVNYATSVGVYDEPIDPNTFAQEVALGNYTNNSYQLYDTYNNVNYYMNATSTTDNSQTSASTTLSKGWVRDKKNRLYINVSNTKMYTYGRTSNTNPTEVVSSTSDADTLTFTQSSGNTYKIYWTYDWDSYYMYFNTSNMSFVSENNSNRTIKYELTETVYNREIYTPQHNNYVANHQIWEQNHESWEATWNSFANLDSPLSDSKTGPDSYISKDTGYRMVYGADDTTYFPLNVSKDGANGSYANGDYDVSKSNTGYVVSGSSQSSTITYSNSLIRVSEYSISNIDGSFDSSDGAILPQNVYTIDMAGNEKTMDEIPDEQKTKFNDVRDSLYNKALKNSSYVYGLHFIGSQISMDHLVNATNINILGTNHPTYQMPVNSIDFNLKQKGSINVMAGSYYSKTVVNFFSLHKIYRNGDNIADIKEIREIYSDGVANHSYIYKFKDGSYSVPYRIGAGNKFYEMSEDDTSTVLYTERCMPYTADEGEESFEALYESTYSKVFDTNSVANYNGMSITQNSLYYFEIPMNDGEFCLGSSSSGDGGYLLYLDIGASATNLERTIAYEHISHSEDKYDYPKGISFGSNYASVDATNNACMSIKDGYSGDFVVNRDDNANTFTVTTTDWDTSKLGYYKESISGINTATPVNNSTDFTENTEGVLSTSTDTRRMEYIDHNVNQNEYIKTIIADTKTNGEGDYVRDYVEQRYQDGSKVDDEDVEIFTNTGARVANDNTGKYTTTLILPTEDEPGDLYSNTILGQFRIELDNNQTASIDWNMEVDVDDTVTEPTGTFYKFKDYKATYTVAGNKITVIVRKWDRRAEDLYVGTTEVTSVNQQIQVAVTPTQN